MELPKPGDKLLLVEMTEDPDPVPPGATGTVTYVDELWDGSTQVCVDWDHPNDCRGLAIIAEKDTWVLLARP